MVGQRSVSIFGLDSRCVDILETCHENACCDAVDSAIDVDRKQVLHHDQTCVAQICMIRCMICDESHRARSTCWYCFSKPVG